MNKFKLICVLVSVVLLFLFLGFLVGFESGVESVVPDYSMLDNSEIERLYELDRLRVMGSP